MAPPPITTADAGSVLEVEHLVGRHHQVAVDLEAGDAARHRARGEDDVRADQLGPVVDPHHVIRTEGAGADKRRDLSPLHQPLQALPELIDDLLLAGLGLGELDRRRVDGDAELLGAR